MSIDPTSLRAIEREAGALMGMPIHAKSHDGGTHLSVYADATDFVSFRVGGAGELTATTVAGDFRRHVALLTTLAQRAVADQQHARPAAEPRRRKPGSKRPAR